MCSFPLLEAYTNKFKQSTTFFMHEQQRKAWQGVEEKLNSIETWSSAKKNTTIMKRKKFQATYHKGAKAKSHFFKLSKLLQSLVEERKMFNNGGMKECNRW